MTDNDNVRYIDPYEVDSEGYENFIARVEHGKAHGEKWYILKRSVPKSLHDKRRNSTIYYEIEDDLDSEGRQQWERETEPVWSGNIDAHPATRHLDHDSKNARRIKLVRAESARRVTAKAETPKDFDKINPLDWRDSAQKFVKMRHPTLLYLLGQHIAHDETAGCYRPLRLIKAEARGFLDNFAKCQDPKTGKWLSFKPSRFHVGELVASIAEHNELDHEKVRLPCWLNPDGKPPAAECTAFANGILYLPKKIWIPSTPDFLNLTALPFSYDPLATCPTWIATLDQWWPPSAEGEPADEVRLLQEIFGYLITLDMSAQKIFFLLGEPRSGKGTVARVMHKLIGACNTCTPTVKTMSTDRFPLVSWVDKSFALFSEFDISSRDDVVTATNTMKLISGQDPVDIAKHGTASLTGVYLNTRMVVVCQKIPKMSDNSTAFGDRVVSVHFAKSFRDNPDTTLTDRLCQELPGIFNWALVGQHRLIANKRKFTSTEAGTADVAKFNLLASSVRAFSDEYCVLSPALHVTTKTVHVRYEAFCHDNKFASLSETKLADTLVSEVHSGKVKHYRPGGGSRELLGIALKDPGQ